MSEVRDAENITTLEELFRSREFGRPVAQVAPARNDTLFGGTSPRAPLVPLAAGPSADHLTTTHLRQQSQSRNRLFATVSGVAAAVLIAVGFVTGIGKPGSKAQLHSATPPTTPTTTPKPVKPNPIKPVPGTNTNPGSAALASGSGRSSVRTDATLTDVMPPTSPIGPSGPQKPPPSAPTGPTGPAPTGTSGSLLTPVVNLVGHLVTTVGTTVNTAGTGLSGTLPVLTPVTSGVVGGLGNVLTGLGDSLIT
jgi:hypothetical protein